MKADYLEFKDKCIQLLTEIDFLNQVQMTKEEILSVLAGCRLEEAYDALLIRSEQVSCRDTPLQRQPARKKTRQKMQCTETFH